MYNQKDHTIIQGAPPEKYPLHEHESGQLITMIFDVNNINSKIPVSMTLGWGKGRHIKIVGVAMTRLPYTMLATTTQYAFDFHWDQTSVVRPIFNSSTTGIGTYKGLKTTDILFSFPITSYIMTNSDFNWDFQLEAPTEEVLFWVTYNDNQPITILTTGTDQYFKLFFTIWVHP